jgi:hypothetical protein
VAQAFQGAVHHQVAARVSQVEAQCAAVVVQVLQEAVHHTAQVVQVLLIVPVDLDDHQEEDDSRYQIIVYI